MRAASDTQKKEGGIEAQKMKNMKKGDTHGMSAEKKELLRELSDAVVEMDEERAVSASNEAVERRIDAFEAIEKGLADGMERAGRLFEEEEYFIPELLMCSDAMYAGLDVLKPHLKRNEEKKGKVVIGVVEGDTHDIGKNLVRIMAGLKWSISAGMYHHAASWIPPGRSMRTS